jgi:hypothetical protein
MKKSKATFTIENFGIYKGFSANSKTLPKLASCTQRVIAEVDVEFGLILRAKQAKGEVIHWCIDHPNICDKRGRPMAKFEGKEYIRNNDWQFYLGDTLWLPLEDKLGDWHMYFSFKGEVVVEKTFEVSLDDLETHEQNMFWKRRGF